MLPATIDFHFDHAYMQANGVGAGSLLFGQFWSRDPGFVLPFNTSLTAGLWFFVLP